MSTDVGNSVLREYFHAMPKMDISSLAELLQTSVLKMVHKEGRIDSCYRDL
jgi:hypothetical protein